ncbi:hypothetical protein BDN70DRAFT_924446 [Pholiota conissans]|uniref:CCHC-type domain-containing protein n=1 Tax=Pholiota conissans TaxID=109636 RepID=A0A9P5YSM4_9AGAR|nr:hypothetical protein BDN70DRAFT_924446 [Pholiota conissans]
MTRVTNFGRKRTYLQAGFSGDDAQEEPTGSSSRSTNTASTSTVEPTNVTSQEPIGSDTPNPPPKKKRKRTPKSKRDGHAAERAAETARLNGEEPPVPAAPQTKVETENIDGETNTEPTLTRLEKKQKRNLARRLKVQSATEARRLKRIAQKNADTTCFACREKGHAAKDCPTAKAEAGNGEGGGKGTPVVGVCYRCNSKKHTISRCKKPVNPVDPFPYASCFVCNGKGHLASACPLNKAKGVYPNGGSCKLCGDTSHLAKDCGIRQKGREAGADEDDFHMFKRKTSKIEHDEKKEVKLKEMLDIRAGALSGAVKPFGNIPQPKKKVVVFH